MIQLTGHTHTSGVAGIIARYYSSPIDPEGGQSQHDALSVPRDL